MSEHQFIVSLFDKKFITEEIIEDSDHNTSSSSTTTSNSLSSSPPTNNSTVNNDLQQQQSRQLLFGNQFWPTSRPIRDDYIITSNNSIFGSATSPIKKFFNKIWNKMNPNEFLKRNFSSNDSTSSSSEENYDYHLLSQHDYHNEHLRIHKKTCCSSNTSSLTREKKKQSTSVLRKKGMDGCGANGSSPSTSSTLSIPTTSKLQALCYDDMFNKRNPISPPINPVAISRNQSVSYAPRHNLNPLLTPDERTSKPLRLVRFNIYIYWQNCPVKYQIELSRNISFHRFKRVMSQMLRYEMPNDLIVLYHTERYTDDGVMMRSGSNEEINWILLDYLCKSDKIRVVTHDAIWSIYLLMWDDDEISVTLFSRSIIKG